MQFLTGAQPACQTGLGCVLPPVGHALATGDLSAKKPGGGIPPARLEALVGRRLRRAIGSDEPAGSARRATSERPKSSRIGAVLKILRDEQPEQPLNPEAWEAR